MSRRRILNPLDYPAYFNRKDTDMIIKIRNARLAFPDLFQAKAFEAGQEPKFGATFLLAKTDPQVKDVDQAINTVASEKWGAKAKAVLDGIRSNPQKFCFTDGELKSEYDGFSGCFALSAKSKSQPLVIDNDAAKTALTARDGRPYAGCYVDFSIELWAQDNQWGKGIRAKLRAVRFAKDGDAFAGGAPADTEEFDDLGVDSDALV